LPPMQAASLLDGLSFDGFPPFKYGRCSGEVDISRRRSLLHTLPAANPFNRRLVVTAGQPRPLSSPHPQAAFQKLGVAARSSTEPVQSFLPVGCGSTYQYQLRYRSDSPFQSRWMMTHKKQSAGGVASKRRAYPSRLRRATRPPPVTALEMSFALAAASCYRP
jgi:hypothetical protein